ncbi:hypothetical protein B0H67DRAFT_583453 [Lasiosphaeris hirsuta]|uniref:Uncharacterized protein n=1 Tax=Lasiosphaeris hirsuta TaxID=260670 RepID=A0AA40DRP1_9PEZI|nr:hypothetical protein B0H67DRAFT_583453 [Lasiosphaeris hirsuta]
MEPIDPANRPRSRRPSKQPPTNSHQPPQPFHQEVITEIKSPDTITSVLASTSTPTSPTWNRPFNSTL